ncbi:MFS transporter [Phenylobacterium soli]|uniref:MFS transporter n=1 Tax=Phenylobacterium soli TaxID=2170551 RepID=A0A328AB44_9CAUL|nr:MFS transporter [Phenylobacterium soli]RAK51795.1 MFS transporter [Phenylobacterium soli]
MARVESANADLQAEDGAPGASPEALSRGEAQLRWKLTLRLVAPITLLIILNSLDRVNVSFAALRMNQELGLSPQAYGFGVSIFFLGYILLQFPHAMSQRRLGARRWIFLTAFAWGVVAASLAFIRDARAFYALRFLLGATEGGLAPGMLYYLSQWTPRRLRGFAAAGTMLAVPISVVLGGPLSGWLMAMHDNPAGLAGWRWMFLIEGAAPIVLAFVSLVIFKERLEDAGWLSAAEKRSLRAELDREAAELEHRHAVRLADTLRQPGLWGSIVLWFCLMSGAYGLLFWLPMVIKQMSSVSDAHASALSALPWVGIGAGMMLNAWHSDRTQERTWHFAVPAGIAALFLAAAATVPAGWPALVCILVGATAMGSAQGVFWAIPTSFLGGAAAAAGVTVINIMGNSAGVVTPPLFGWLRQATGSFQPPIYAMAALMLVAAVTAVPLGRWAKARL